MNSAFVSKSVCCVAISCVLAGMGGVSHAQTLAACGGNGYRVSGQRWDAVLRMGLEYRQECAHPERPARLVALGSAASGKMADNAPAKTTEVAMAVEPLLVNAGSSVRLWMQDAMVRIEISGVVERSARKGERVTVKVTHQSDETGLTVERIQGIVRGPAEVEMER